MPVYQVEEYYITLNVGEGNICGKVQIEDTLENEGYSDYEWQDDRTIIVVDGIPSESEAEGLEERLKECF